MNVKLTVVGQIIVDDQRNLHTAGAEIQPCNRRIWFYLQNTILCQKALDARKACSMPISDMQVQPLIVVLPETRNKGAIA